MPSASKQPKGYPVLFKLGQKFQQRYQQKYQKYGYSLLSRRLGRDDVVFLNFGYEEDPPMSLPLDAADEPIGTASSSTTARRPRRISAAGGCWKLAAATAAGPHISRAPCVPPRTPGSA